MKIILQSPSSLIQGKERKSKLIDPTSDLYRHLESMRSRLVKKYGSRIGAKRMDYHVEVIRENEPYSESLVNSRSQEVHNVELTNLSEYTCIGKAFCLQGPTISGYGPTHITIAFFPKGVPDLASHLVSVVS